MKKFALLLAFTVPLLGNVQAEEKEDTTACMVGDVKFSKGSTIRVGTRVMVCKRDQEWAPTQRKSTGCLYDGELYSEGAERAIKTKGNPVIRCVANGSWRRL